VEDVTTIRLTEELVEQEHERRVFWSSSRRNIPVFDSGLENAFGAVYGRYDDLWHKGKWKTLGGHASESPSGSFAWA
jgi:hypothetical protein